MKYERTFFVGKQPMGTAPASMVHTHGELHAPYSEAFFCPTCGEIWGRMLVSPPTQWIVHTLPCEHHPRGLFEVSGTMWLPWYGAAFLDEFPEAMLKREFKMILTHLEAHNATPTEYLEQTGGNS